MLEARDACSGATTRNGGHITPPLYHDYLDLKKKHGAEAASLTEESQCRKVDTYDVYFDKDVFEGAKEKLGRYLEELPSEKGGWGATEGPAGMQLADGVCGVISTTGGATYSPFRLYTHSPCLSIHDNIVHTPRGDILAKHIIVPVRGHITARRARRGFDGGWLGTLSFVLYPGASEDQQDYLIQQLPDSATLREKPHAEFMFGGGPSFLALLDPYYPNLSDVTIIAPIEDGLSIQDIKVPNQRAYTGSKPVIPSSLADTLSGSLGVDGLMKTMNSTLGTKYDLTPSLSSLLAAYISDGYDFGTVYAYLRPIWFDCDLNDIEDSLRTSEAMDLEIRQGALVDGQITENGLFMAPRRVWDLFSNRVVPWWVALHTPWGISHAWLDISRRKNVLTPINRQEWPVPIPEDVNLDLVRIEMLNLGAEYAWLDVLCLRQEGGQNEDLRVGEWMLDVPTIGNAYVLEKVACYFNGLGRPLERGFDFDSDRSWFKRTWTLQETSENWMIGGDTGDEVLNEKIQERFRLQLVSVEARVLAPVFYWLSLLQDRTSEKDVDKVAALTYFLPCDSIPAHNETRPTTSTAHDYTKIDPASKDNPTGTGDPTSTIAPAYSELESAEDAWTVLVKVMVWYLRSEILFLYHDPGPEKNAWRPSWQQAMNWDTRSISMDFNILWGVHQNMETGTYSYDGWCIESVLVQGLATPIAAPRKGHLIVQTPNGEEHRYEISARHQCLIPDGVYSLLCARQSISNETSCVVGKMLPDRTFIKTSVFETIDLPEDEKKWESMVLSMGAKKSHPILG
ncbi:uncharacterized protein ARMOST_08563 [Armillaria ostoyae]|uniref:Heterokaryon incompatibility domain-containing protein n=1 Tax=Armillaria ostoyae TaxID=47428 RepID=A0A284R8Z3_ARMOS|nr:uncharacterized protein ARMOST_08563 [Armillaria ostoyae]